MNPFHSMRLLPFLLVPFLALSMLTSCNRRPADQESDEEAGPQAPPVVPVRIAKVYRGDAFITVSATGKTDALRKEKIFSPVAGRIIALKALEGTPVHKGDVVATIRPKEAETAITGAEALLQRAQTPAQREEAQRALALAEGAQNTVDLHAAFNGTISARTVTEGELVTENSELFTLVDMSSLVFLADVPLSALPDVHPGQRADIRFSGLPGRSFAGVIESLNPQSDPQSQTVKGRLRFAGAASDLLRTEMAGTARIITGVHHQALLIPRPALLHDDEHNTYSVVAVGPDSVARVVAVTVGIISDSTAEVAAGSLQPGTDVVVEGNYALADSTKVTIAGEGSP